MLLCPGSGADCLMAMSHPLDPARGESCLSDGCPDFLVFEQEEKGPLQIDFDSDQGLSSLASPSACSRRLGWLGQRAPERPHLEPLLRVAPEELG